MATIQNDLVIRGLSGKVGGQLAMHQKRDGQYKIYAANVHSHQPSYGEEPDKYHQNLYEALLCSPTTPHVQDRQANESRKIKYGGGVSADVIHPPEIRRIDISKYTGLAGELICITAGDDVKVAAVGVLIVTDDGILVEKGSAILSEQNPYVWTYTTTETTPSRTVKILVDVADVAPHREELLAM
jgi:hypothetical protein